MFTASPTFSNRMIIVIACVMLFGIPAAAGQPAKSKRIMTVFPSRQWQTKSPDTAGIDTQKLKRFVQAIGGDGIIIRFGYMIMAWGDAARRRDWASAGKPVISTLLLFAVMEGKLKSVDDLVRPWMRRRWPKKDFKKIHRNMTFRHLANMTSGYGRGEVSGTHYAYNDYGIKLYGHVMSEVFDSSLNKAAVRRFAPLQLQDGDVFASRGGMGVNTSPRDFARIGWFWLNKGRWNDKQLLPVKYFDKYCRADVPGKLPRTKKNGSDYLKIGSHGGGADQSELGPGIYGFNWWFNGKIGKSNKTFMPHLPKDTIQANGHWGRECMLIIPSLQLVVAARGNWGGTDLKNARLLMEALIKNNKSERDVNSARAKQVLLTSVNSRQRRTGPLSCPGVGWSGQWSRPTSSFVALDAQLAIKPGPIPPSRVIKAIEFDWKTRRDLAPGSDNWPITWGKDGHQYTSWGDGGGFGGTNSKGRVSLGVARVVGPAGNYRGQNVWGGHKTENRATFGGKSYGILDVDGKLYMWLRQVDRTHAKLAYSPDKGAAWKKASWDFSPKNQFNTGTFLQFGPGYAKSRDDYVYSYFIRTENRNFGFIVHKPGKIDLARVHNGKILDRDAYEFFAGFDSKNQPRWTRNAAKRKPAFQDPRGVSWVLSVTHNAGLKRYLLTTEHTRWQSGNIGIFDAPEPWGPWTEVPYHKKFPGWTFTFSNKWTSPDGKEFTAIFTPRDNWAMVRGRFVLHKQD